MNTLRSRVYCIACTVALILLTVSARCQQPTQETPLQRAWRQASPRIDALTEPTKFGVYTADLTTTWNGLTRYYDLYVPANLAAAPTLWIMLHGTTVGTTMPGPFDRIPLAQLANQNGFIVAWPISTFDGVSWYWDSYFLDPDFVSAPDDSGYIRSLILQLEQQFPTITNVVVAGDSSGGFMAHRVVIDSADLVSAASAWGAQLYSGSDGTVPTPEQPVSVLMLNGDQDARVAYCGQAHEWGNTSSPSSDVTLDYWAAIAGYTGTLPQLCTNSQPTQGVNGALLQSAGVTVQFVREVGVGHNWLPGTEKVMWTFFQDQR